MCWRVPAPCHVQAELPASPLPPPHLQVYAGHWSGIQVAVKVLITRDSFEAEVEGEGLQLPESVQVRRCPALQCHARCLDAGCNGPASEEIGLPAPITCRLDAVNHFWASLLFGLSTATPGRGAAGWHAASIP